MNNAIEWVGYGSIGREHIAWLVAREIISSKGLDDKVENISSGTHILGHNTNKYQMENYQKKILQRALQRGELDYDHENNVEFALSNHKTPSISEYFKSILPKLKQEERDYMTEALAYFNISPGPERELQATIALPHTKYIFCMENDNLDVVTELYEHHNNSPQVHLINHNGNKIEGAFGRDKEVYFKMVEQVKNYVETVLPQKLDTLHQSLKNKLID